MAKKENFNNMNIDDLKKKLAELRDNLRNIKFKNEGAKPKNVKESKNIRIKIARILTAINQVVNK